MGAKIKGLFSHFGTAFVLMVIFFSFATWRAQTAINDAKKLGTKANLAAIQAKDFTHYVQQQSCQSTNRAYRAIRISKVAVEHEQIGQVTELRARYLQTLKFTPPKTAKEKMNAAAGIKFFNQYYSDTVKLAEEATRHTFQATELLHCSNATIKR